MAEPLNFGDNNYGGYWNPTNNPENAWNSTGYLPTTIHNSQEAINADKRSYEMALQAQGYNSAEAQKERDWLTEMSNTSERRRLADLKAAGFSPLALLGSGGASTPSSSPAHSGSPSGHSSSGDGSRFLGGIVSALAGIITSGMSSAAKVAAATSMAAIKGATSSESYSRRMDPITYATYHEAGSRAALRDFARSSADDEGVMDDKAFKAMMDGIGKRKR